jgi:Tol biopolymer transport system component
MTTTVSEPFDKMSFSRAPWSPDGTHLAMRLLTHNGLAVLSIIDGSIVFLDETHPNSDAPLWSPDGRYLLFRTETINSQTPPRIAVYGLESGVIERETLPVELISLVGWSPDSSKVAMIRWNKENEMNGQVPVLEVLDLASGIAKVYQNPGKNFWVDGSWSPREDKLVLFGVDPDMGIPEPGFLVYSYRSIDLIDLDTGLVNLLLVGGTHDDEVNNSELPSLYINKMPWSPDGESIIYSDLGKVCYLDISSISVLCPDDLNSILLSTGAVGVDYPSWSPSGEWIGFVLSLPDTYGGPIAVIRPDGSDLRFTDQSSGEITLFGPVWSPNQ